ncbi:MAG TPA: hypothetical protein VJQ43_02560, partial [Thermoplasmata archaeon]|nr:hypothetical protein [Thermoplasmata archaeon]
MAARVRDAGRSPALLSAAAVGVLLALLVAQGLPYPGPSGGSQAPPGALAAASRASAPLAPHAALYSNDSAPTGTLPPGEELEATYLVQVANFTSSVAGAIVRIPNAYVQLPTKTGSLHLYLDPVNVTITSSAAVTATAGPLTRYGPALAFNATGSALLSTQGLAVMAGWPNGGPAVQFRWHWTIIAPDGSTSGGPWSAPSNVVPDQLALLAPPISHVWVTAGSYTMCLLGSLGGRTFSLHVATTSPVQQIDAGSATAPAVAVAHFCWNSTLPANVTPQSVVLHLWEYGAIPYLLYAVSVDVVSPPAPAPLPKASGGSAWVVPVLAAA